MLFFATISRQRKIFLFLLILASIGLAVILPRRTPPLPTTATTARLQEAYGRVPLHFEANQGQFHESVNYITRGKGYSIALTQQAAVVELENEHSARIQMKLKGANPQPRVRSQQQLEAKVNYFLGNDPKQWKTDVPTFAQVKYEQVYPGTDVVYYGNQQQLEYDFIVAPQADPTAIKLEFTGANELRLDEAGNLLLATEAGELKQHKPIVYQEVAGGYRLCGNEVSFEVGTYDRNLPLIIDPVVSYATFWNSATEAIAVDAAGNAYVAGGTGMLTSFATTGAVTVQNSGSPSNATFAFVAKFNSTGTKLLYAAVMGGPTPVAYGRDCDVQNPDRGKCTYAITYNKATGIAVDTRGNVYVTGYTVSTDFPTTAGALQRTYRHTLPYLDGNIPSTTSSPGAFVIKLNATGSAMAYSTLLGNGSQGEAIAVDAEGQAVVTGYTYDDVPTKNAFQAERRGGNDAYLAKLNATGSGLVYSTYLGSESGDLGRDVALDQDGNAYLLGETYNGGGLGDKPRGIRFPTTPGAYRTSEGNVEGLYVAKFDREGNVNYSTLIGGWASSAAIAIDALGCAYVTGSTFEGTYPVTPGAYQPKPADDCSNSCFSDTVISKLSAGGGSLVYSTYFGTSKVDNLASGIAVDANGNTYLAIRNVYPDATGVIVSDTEIVKFNADETQPASSLVLPGAVPSDIALDANGNAYLTGAGTSRFSPTPNTYLTYGGRGIVAKITEVMPPRASFYSISGTVTFRYGPPPYFPYEGVKVLLQGTVNRTATTDSNGRYTFDRVPAGGNYFVLPDPLSYAPVWPMMRTITDLSASQVANFELRDYISRLVSNVSAASFKPGPLAHESIVSAFGANLTTKTAAATTLPLPTTLADTRVTVIDGTGAEREAGLFFVSPTQVNYVLPAGLMSGAGIVRVWGAQGGTSVELIQLDPVTPGLFSADASGKGVAAANVQRVKANGTQSNETVVQFDATRGQLMPIPIDLGAVGDKVYLALFGTGVRNRRDLANVSATVGGLPASVTYAGSQNSFVGVDQINVMIPRELAGRGEVEVVLQVEGKSANTVKVKIK